MSVKEAVRKRIPDVFWLRSLLTKLKLRQYYRYVMPEAEIDAAEASEAVKAQTAQRYARKWPDYAAKVVEKIDEILEKTPSYRDRKGDEALRTDMMFCRFAYGFQPDEYLCYHLEGKDKAAKRAYVSDIDRYRYVTRMNDLVDFVDFMDKGRTYALFKDYYKREAISISRPEHLERFKGFVERHPVFVKKQVWLSKGDSVQLVDMTACGKTVDAVFNEMIAQGKHIIEERIVQSEEMSRLNASSVNTVRCITLYTRSGVVVPYTFLKVGRGGSFVDNGGKGGLLVGIEVDTGILRTDGFDEFLVRYPVHPESGVTFNGYPLPQWDRMLAICKEMSAKTPNVRYIGWDMAHTPDGWVVVEGNGGGQMIGPQIVWERGIKEEMDRYAENMKLLA